MADQWQQPEPVGPGVLQRLLVPQGGERPATLAFIAGLAGTVAFVASLVLDWQHIAVTTDLGSSESSSRVRENVVTAGIGSIDVLGLVYLLGALGMIVLAGSVLTRPDAAMRTRAAGLGLGVGVVAVLVAVVIRLPQTIFNVTGVFGGLSTDMQHEMIDKSEITYEPGMFCGFAAMALLTAAVWLAGQPAARAAAAGLSGHPVAGYPYPVQPYPPQGYGPQPFPVQPAAGYPAPGYPPVTVGPAAPAAAGPVVAGPNGAASAVPTSPLAGAPAPGGPSSPGSAPSSWASLGRAGYVDDLSVSPSEPIDPGTNTDVWRR